ncbi:hypothetical protein COCON_G00034520 [Conger conger]|uniref:Uncharacterized protein n=1 Tax=Conger conger TaxID=82655 RepID=A0A9Q1DZE2_CONCO|nr:hypothetical protein COCON_G00034520 [Conger conger]
MLLMQLAQPHLEEPLARRRLVHPASPLVRSLHGSPAPSTACPFPLLHRHPLRTACNGKYRSSPRERGTDEMKGRGIYAIASATPGSVSGQAEAAAGPQHQTWEDSALDQDQENHQSG